MGVLHDLSGSSVAHALLAGPLVGAHLQPDHVLAGLQLLVTELPLVLLRFPANTAEERPAVWWWWWGGRGRRSWTRSLPHSLEEPAGVPLICAFVLGDSQAPQG